MMVFYSTIFKIPLILNTIRLFLYNTNNIFKQYFLLFQNSLTLTYHFTNNILKTIKLSEILIFLFNNNLFVFLTLKLFPLIFVFRISRRKFEKTDQNSNIIDSMFSSRNVSDFISVIWIKIILFPSLPGFFGQHFSHLVLSSPILFVCQYITNSLGTTHNFPQTITCNDQKLIVNFHLQLIDLWLRNHSNFLRIEISQ